jgi:hypothetical protein
MTETITELADWKMAAWQEKHALVLHIGSFWEEPSAECGRKAAASRGAAQLQASYL